MICYKDMTFCYSDCTLTSCFRYYGTEQEAAAKEWSKAFGDGEPLVAFSDYSKVCPYYQSPNK